MKKIFVIINFNTQNFVDKLIMSINKFVGDVQIVVFDNSDKTPYINTFDNVNVIDNTAGSIINFDKWLENYPERTKTSAIKNNYGSAKHCYTVDKCMDIFEDGFVLLDSDILLKRDISEIIKEDKAFVGDTEMWKAAKTADDRIVHPRERAIPYICYINSKKCKELGIRYFNDDCMFGLTENGDSYDTGSYFFEEIIRKNAEWKKINYHNYIVHYKAGSWVEEAKRVDNYRPMPVENWLNCYKSYWMIDN